ncbi:MAG: helix-turn-helix domain-containing protein [Rhodomicrobium sp.]
MNSISPGRASAPQDGENSVERLQAFMKTHNLSLEDLAKLLRTPPQTLEDWFNDGLSPPASLLAVMILLETLPQAWSFFGIDRGQSSGIAPAPLTPEEALRRVRAI